MAICITNIPIQISWTLNILPLKPRCIKLTPNHAMLGENNKKLYLNEMGLALMITDPRTTSSPTLSKKSLLPRLQTQTLLDATPLV